MSSEMAQGPINDLYPTQLMSGHSVSTRPSCCGLQFVIQLSWSHAMCTLACCTEVPAYLDKVTG
jgi:hypothetical protein